MAEADSDDCYCCFADKNPAYNLLFHSVVGYGEYIVPGRRGFGK